MFSLAAIGVVDGSQWHSVEFAGCTHSVSTHLAPAQPVTDLETSGKRHDLTDTVDRVAGRAPDRGLLHSTVAHRGAQVDGKRHVRWRRSQKSWDRGLQRVRDGQGVRVNDLVIEHDAVEGSVDAIVDVVWEMRHVS